MGMPPLRGRVCTVLASDFRGDHDERDSLDKFPCIGEGNGGRNARTHRGGKKNRTHVCEHVTRRGNRGHKGLQRKNTTSARQFTNTHAHTRFLSLSLFHSVSRTLAKHTLCLCPCLCLCLSLLSLSISLSLSLFYLFSLSLSLSLSLAHSPVPIMSTKTQAAAMRLLANIICSLEQCRCRKIFSCVVCVCVCVCVCV
jgi:hypothetical protein